MKFRALMCGVVLVTSGMAIAEDEDCPVGVNVRGHENVEWSTFYAFHMADQYKDLPRVLLIGDSICNGYQDRVRNLTEGVCNISYWISSYCVTSPEYMRLLDFYLSYGRYDVVHFNNGLHSLQTDTSSWSAALKRALTMIRAKQPHARIIWASSTPLKDASKTAKAQELNQAAASVVKELGEIETDDLFSLLDPLDRGEHWRDTYHHQPTAIELEARQVAEKICRAGNIDISVKFDETRTNSVYRSVLPQHAKNPKEIWPMEQFGRTPKTWGWADPFVGEATPMWMEGASCKGKSTRCFAFVGKPSYASSTNKVPGIVLMHGGAGTAYPEWVRLWVKRGYAAICVDNCGAIPVRLDDGSWMNSPFGGPHGWGRFDAVNEPITDQWLYHAVAAGILAHSYLRSLDCVDSACIGVTGISWGGVITCIMAAADDRFAYAVPVYGCGFNDVKNGLAWNQDNAQQWMRLWDPSVYLPYAKCPFLWVDGTNDHGFSLQSVSRSAALVKGPSEFCTRLRMVHAHGPAGEAPAEIWAFANGFSRQPLAIATLAA